MAVRTDEPMVAVRPSPGIPPGGNVGGPHGRIRPAAAAAAWVTAGLLVCTGCTGSASSASSAVSASSAAPGRPSSAAAALPSRSLASPDGRFAIVTLESADEAVVFNLSRALASRFSPADDVGAIPLGAAPAGLAVSPDGRWLYATSEVGVSAPSAGGPAAAATLSSSQAAACSETFAGESG